MIQKIGSVLMASGALVFGAGWLSSAYLEGKVRDYPLTPDYSKGEIFRASAGRGVPGHYVPAHLHDLVSWNGYFIVVAFGIFAVGYYLRNRPTKIST